jgi:hypothetical protein
MGQALSNANADLCATQPNYVLKITGDNPEGKAQLDNFIDPEKRYPVIATTSKLIVLDQNIRSMTMFKQIIGRGTRLREELGKTWFTILDFKRATDNFADPTFDGEPVQIYEPTADESVNPPDAALEATSGVPADPLDAALQAQGELNSPCLIRHISRKVGAVQLAGAGALGHPVAVNLAEGGHNLGQRQVVEGAALLHVFHVAVGKLGQTIRSASLAAHPGLIAISCHQGTSLSSICVADSQVTLKHRTSPPA